MKKYFKFYLIAWVILLAIFNLIVFLTPTELAGMNKFGGAFWPGYVLITLALIGQLVCAFFAFRTDRLDKVFLNLPLIRISYLTLIVSVIVGIASMAIPDLPVWVGIVACLLILGFSALAVINAGAAAALIGDVDAKVKAKTFFIKLLTADAESLIAKADNDEARSAAKKVFEAIRYSDPMSDDALAGLESQIAEKFADFTTVIRSGADNSAQAADEVIRLVSERNIKCKMLK